MDSRRQICPKRLKPVSGDCPNVGGQGTTDDNGIMHAQLPGSGQKEQKNTHSPYPGS
jgi:hypothetical protein